MTALQTDDAEPRQAAPSSRYAYLFGPVPSRRLGRSLGIDLVPRKTCSYNCVFCQLGRTERTTLERRVYVPLDAVRAELEHWYATDGDADAVTLAGGGEPTLHTQFGDVIRAANAMGPVPTILMTNGSLLDDPDVRRDAACAGVVKSSLSAWDQASLVALNRPHPHLRFDRLLEGLRRLRQRLAGQLWIEVFIVPGINDAPADVRRIAELVRSVSPDRIDLNTAVRPPAEAGVAALGVDRLHDLAMLFDPVAEVAVHDTRTGTCETRVLSPERLVAMVERHPVSAADVAGAFGIAEKEATTILESLCEEERLVRAIRDGRICYTVPTSDGP